MVKVLLDNGGNPNSQTVKIINPSGGLPAEFLIEGDTTPVSQQTPLHLALAQGNSEIVSLFLQYKCKQFLYLSISNPLTVSLLGKFACFLSSADLIQNHFLEKFFQKTLSVCQTAWTQIRTNIMSVLIWVKTVCKGYQLTTLVGKELSARTKLLR